MWASVEKKGKKCGRAPRLRRGEVEGADDRRGKEKEDEQKLHG